jgi:hypothetical protein
MSKTPKNDQQRALREAEYERQKSRRRLDRDTGLHPVEDTPRGAETSGVDTSDIPEATEEQFKRSKTQRLKPKKRRAVPIEREPREIAAEVQGMVDAVKRGRGRPKTKTSEERKAYRRDWMRRNRGGGLTE